MVLVQCIDGRDMAKIGIIGCGRLGKPLGTLLAQKNHQVWGAKRHPDCLPEGITPVQVDLYARKTLHALPIDTDYLYVILTPDGHEKQDYRNLYTQAIPNLLMHYQQHPPKRLIFVSSTRVYGATQGQWVDEHSLTTPLDFRGDYLLQAERMLLSSNLPATILRFSGIYGPHRNHLLKQIQSGKTLSGEHRCMNHIHEKDCVGILANMSTQKFLRPLYTASDAHPIKKGILIKYLATALGVTQPMFDHLASDRSISNQRVTSRYLLEVYHPWYHSDCRKGYAEIINELKLKT